MPLLLTSLESTLTKKTKGVGVAMPNPAAPNIPVPVSNYLSMRRLALRIALGLMLSSLPYPALPAPPQQSYAAPPEPDHIAQLKELAALRQQGVLTDEEFAAEKAKLLA